MKKTITITKAEIIKGLRTENLAAGTWFTVKDYIDYAESGTETGSEEVCGACAVGAALRCKLGKYTVNEAEAFINQALDVYSQPVGGSGNVEVCLKNKQYFSSPSNFFEQAMTDENGSTRKRLPRGLRAKLIAFVKKNFPEKVTLKGSI